MSSNPSGPRSLLPAPLPVIRTPFRVELRLETGGDVVAAEPVRDVDLRDAVGELWWHGVLRRGRMQVALEEGAYRVSPLLGNAPRCSGFLLETDGPDGSRVERRFDLRVLAAVADRAASRLVREGTLAGDQTYYYDLVATDAQPQPLNLAPQASPSGVRAAGEERTHAPRVLDIPLAPLLDAASAVSGGRSPDDHVIVYTDTALEKAERFSRRGERETPPRESGCVLVGPLCRCPDTGDLFVVITDVLEATEAEEESFSLSFTGATWSRIQRVLSARRSRPATRADRIVGQAHGHNFVPGGDAPPCEPCARQTVCGRDSASLSPDDRTWCRAVFAGQPWQISHIFGLNARGDATRAFYGQRSGELTLRGYHLVTETRFNQLRDDALSGPSHPGEAPA